MRSEYNMIVIQPTRDQSYACISRLSYSPCREPMRMNGDGIDRHHALWVVEKNSNKQSVRSDNNTIKHEKGNTIINRRRSSPDSICDQQREALPSMAKHRVMERHGYQFA